MARTVLALVVLLGACGVPVVDGGDDSDGDSDSDGATDVPVDSEPVETDPPVDPLVRGAYLVDHVIGCADCHAADLGGALHVDLDPDDPEHGEVWAPNLTPDATGLAAWSDDQLRAAISLGHDPDGRPLLPLMPSWLYGHLADDDLDAVVAHLRALPPVEREVPAPDVTVLVASPRLPLAAIPDTTLVLGEPDRPAAVRGRYLGTIGGCIDCHTADGAPLYPVDTARVLAGGRTLADGAVTPNLTPDATGLSGWTVDDVAAALTDGVDPTGRALCPTMPAGPAGRLGGLTVEDARAIGVWLTTIPPVAGDVAPTCPE